MRKGRTNKKDMPYKDTGVTWTTAIAMGSVKLYDLQQTNKNKFRWVMRSFRLELERHGMALRVDTHYYVLLAYTVTEEGSEPKLEQRAAEYRAHGAERIAQEALRIMFPDHAAAA